MRIKSGYYGKCVFPKLQKDIEEALKAFLNRIGSCYLHLDSNADYYGKILLDNLFGNENFRVKITWKKHTGPKIQSSHFPKM